MAGYSSWQFRQAEREAERDRLYWNEEAILADRNRYAADELKSTLDKIQERRNVLDAQEASWKENVGPLDFTPDKDMRKSQNRRAKEEADDMILREQKRGRGESVKFWGKTPMPYESAKFADAELEQALSSSGSESDSESGEGDEGDEGSEGDEEGEGDEEDEEDEEDEGDEEDEKDEADEKDEVDEWGLDETTRDEIVRRYYRELGYFDDLDNPEANVKEGDTEATRMEYLKQYEQQFAWLRNRSFKLLLEDLKTSMEFFENQAVRAVQSAEECEEATKAVADVIENWELFEDKSCHETMKQVKKKVDLLRSAIAKALNDAYSVEELAAYVDAGRVSLDEQTRRSRDPHTRVRDLMREKRRSMFAALVDLQRVSELSLE